MPPPLPLPSMRVPTAPYTALTYIAPLPFKIASDAYPLHLPPAIRDRVTWGGGVPVHGSCVC